MSHMVVIPELLTSAATELERIGSTLSAVNAAAAGSTTGLLGAGADEVSAAVAALFAGHAHEYQTLSARASTFHAQFVQALTGHAGSYVAAEAANASPLQPVLDVINTPTQLLLGRPLIGDGANGGPGQSGGNGGLLYGNGGNGGSSTTPGQAGGNGGGAGFGGNGGAGGAGGAG
ncbi:PE family protein, partial [Mycobacterium basiliense]|uniref:PE family protein n=1 Tax=Mycobacterium basiliense TaxID=2094119 RepID=UPI0039EF801C